MWFIKLCKFVVVEMHFSCILLRGEQNKISFLLILKKCRGSAKFQELPNANTNCVAVCAACFSQRGIFKGEGVSVYVRPRTVMETRAVFCVSELAKLSALRPAKVKLA
jgi:hypothetical protein